MFVVAGEALVDVVLPRDASPRRTPGGSPLNVAVGLARLGVATLLLTEFGDDAAGDLVRRHLEGSGVRLAEGAVVPGRRTSTATARLDETGAASYDFDIEWTLREGTGLPEGATGLHVGSLGVALRPGRDAVLALVREAAAAGLPVTFDPNARPSLTPDADQAWADVLEVAAHCDVVKLSDEDLHFLRPGLSPDALAELLLGQGVRLVVVTLGGGGAAAYAPGAVCRVSSRPVPVVDTVGAGDSFMAALVAVVLEQGHDWLDHLDNDRLHGCLLAAHAAAAVTVSRPGADPPRRDELPAGWPLGPAELS